MTARFTRRAALGMLGAGALAACNRSTEVAPPYDEPPRDLSVGAARASTTSSTTTAPSTTPAPSTTTTLPPPAWSAENLGLNYAWLNDHHGNQRVNWLADGYDHGAVEADLDLIAGLGVRVVRAFCALEAVMSFDGSQFAVEPNAMGNLHQFLDAATARGLSVIPVMADGNVGKDNRSLDGKFRWQLTTSPEGLAVYAAALRAYVSAVNGHGGIACWQTFNEPYATVTGSTRLAALGIDADTVHNYLRRAYEVVKEMVGRTAVIFSDLHEEQQAKYRIFSDPVRRARYVDNCTDVYALHVFRSRVDELADLSQLGSRPKWCVELGNTNYRDRTGAEHGGRAGNLELYDEDANADAVQQLGSALLAGGFTLVLPWSMADNPGMFTHNADGTHTVKRLPTWMSEQLHTGA